MLCLTDSGLAERAAAHVRQRVGVAPTLLLSFRELRRRPRVALGLPWRRFDVVVAVLGDVRSAPYRDVVVAYLVLLRARRKALGDVSGGEIHLGWREELGAVLRCVASLAGLPSTYLRARWAAWRLARPRAPRPACRARDRRVAYLRSNLWHETGPGGAAAHTAGVLAGLRQAGIRVSYLGATDSPAARASADQVHVVPVGEVGWRLNLPELMCFAYGQLLARRARTALAASPPAFVYQRASLLDVSGAGLADRFRCPLVLEYNGSEVWLARNWGAPLMLEGLAAAVEHGNLRSADLVVVVSGALRDEIVTRGVLPGRVLVNPNGVDPARFHPGVDGSRVRARLGLDSRVVVGFLGTFDAWHGVEVLARTVPTVARRLPGVHFLCVGDGSRMAAVKEIVSRAGAESSVTFTGLIPHGEVPEHLAACDILVSPHVANPDGSRFFGSPTKLFEYMAMGKAIVASDLEQIGEVLAHERTAWLVPPGKVDDLGDGIVTLGRAPDTRARLGEAARAEVVARYTWDANVRRLLGRLEERGLF